MPREIDIETAVALRDPLLGSIFDKRFHIEERIASGGFGAIYRAKHVKSGHPIALKVLHPSLASDLGVLARFRREGTTLTTLRSPHTITAYEFGQSDYTLFIVMELLYGQSLYDRYSDNGPLEWKRVVHIAKQVCESLEEAHSLGIVHRDLKPTNIHLENIDGDPDFVKVLDFGIAKIIRGSDLDSADITNAGQMIGTLDYMSPEQMVGGHITGQTDIYTLGIVMYEMIAGTRPFPESATASAALAAMIKTTPQALYLRAPVPRPLDDIVMRCLENETTKRYRSVAQLREDLERLVGDSVPAASSTVRLAKQMADDEETTITPPPERLMSPTLAESLTSLERSTQLADWDEEDESAPTSTRRPDGSDDAASIEPIPSPVPRPLAARHQPTPVPQVVVAPFSARQLPRDPAAAALGLAQTTLQPAAFARGQFPQGLPPGVPSPYQGPGSGRVTANNPLPHASTTPGTPGASPPGRIHAPTPPPGRIHAPTPPPANISLTTTSPGHAPARPSPVGYPSTKTPTGPTPLPPTPAPNYLPPTPRPATAPFDMGSLTARETLIRRIIWGGVLIIAAVLGFVLASRL